MHATSHADQPSTTERLPLKVNNDSITPDTTCEGNSTTGRQNCHPPSALGPSPDCGRRGFEGSPAGTHPISLVFPIAVVPSNSANEQDIIATAQPMTEGVRSLLNVSPEQI